MFNNFFKKLYVLYCLRNNVEKYCTAGQATDDKTVRHMRTACWTTKATNTHSEYVTLQLFAATMLAQTRPSVRYTFSSLPVLFQNNLSSTHFYA